MVARYSKSQYVIPVILLLILWRLLIIELNAPWFGHHDANGLWISAVARNFRTYGLAELGPIPVMNRGAIPPEVINRYPHHPPLLPYAATLATVLFGDHEMSLRLVSIFSTMIAVSAFYVFCRRLYKRQNALLYLLFFAFTPMIVFFGRMPDHEAMSLAFLLTFLAVLVNWTRQPTRQRWWLLLLLAILGIWTAWATCFFVALIGVFGWWKGKSIQRWNMVALVVVAVLAAGSVVAFFQLFDSNTLTELQRTFLWRTSTVSEISEDFTLLQFIGQQLVHLVAYATIAVLVLGIIGVVPTLRRAKGMTQAILLAMLIAPLIYVSVFRSASYVHDYYEIYLIPFLSISAANTVSIAFRQPKLRRFARPAIVGLFAVSLAFAALYMRGLYTSSYTDDVLAFARNVADHTAPQEVVLSNFPDANPVVEYYANRYMLWNIQPADALARAEVLEYSSIYVYCGDDPAAIAALPIGESVTESDGCRFIQFAPK